MSLDDVKEAIEEKEPLIFLDVRTLEEYAKGHIANSIHVPVDDISKKITSAIPEKNKKVVVYCLSGSRSMFAVQEMMKMGYTQVFTLTSGLLGWRAQQHPLTIE